MYVDDLILGMDALRDDDYYEHYEIKVMIKQSKGESLSVIWLCMVHDTGSDDIH